MKFETSVYKRSRAFSIPVAVSNELGIDYGDSIHLIVKNLSGEILFSGRKTLRSGAEIYGKDIAPSLTPGTAISVEVSDPVTMYRSPSEEAKPDKFAEGTRVSIQVNRFERNRKARQQCIKIFGATCQVCGFDFGKVYGKLGRGFIHVHRLTPVSEIGNEHQIDPSTDLRPVCPNCHEMLHSGFPPPISIETLRAIMADQKNPRPEPGSSVAG